MDHTKVTVIRPPMPDIPGYAIKKKIGEGGMATVYLATQESLDRMVALKIVAPSITAIDPHSSERFLKEGRIVANLNHPNIVTIYDIGKEQSSYYMAMEYISDGNLSDRLNDRTVHDPLGIIREIAKALGYAHKCNIIHRDIKPANILFREDGSIVLSDFGIAKALSSQTCLTTTGFTAGTPHYMSPEQARGESIDARTDLYSLGVVFYEMLAGKKPFKGEDSFGTAMSHISAPIPFLPEQFSYYQPIIDRLLAKDPDDRYTSAEQLIKALDRHGVSGRDLGDKTRIQIKNHLVRPGHAINERVKHPAINIVWILRWSALVVVLVGIIVGGYHWFSAPKIDPQTRWIINMMLEKAGRQLESSRLIEPVGDNAYKSYRDILELMPDNRNALDGLQIITDKIEQQAIEKQSQGDFDDGLALVEKGLLVSPDSKNLLGRKEELNSLIQDRKFQDELARMLAQADSYIEELKYTEPAEGNAYTVYQEILKLDPENKKAQNGVRRIAEHFGVLAFVQQQKGQYRDGLNLVINGLQIDPQNQRLLSLKKSITAEIEETELQGKIADLFAKAEQQLSESKIIVPSGDNAFASYQEILIVDSGNNKAKDGIQRVIKTVLDEVRKRESDENYEGALVLVDNTLALQPDNREALTLREDINGKLEIKVRFERIREMETLAKKQTVESKLLFPPGDNAYETYQEILKLDAENKSARNGLDGVAKRVIQLAKDDQKQGLLEESIKKLDQGLEVYPKNKEIKKLRDVVAKQLGEERVAQQLNRLIDKAKQQISDKKYISPVNDNAYETYMKIAEFDPENPSLKKGLNSIAKHYERLAQQAEHDGRLAAAVDAINHALKVAPENKGMAELKSRVMAKLEDLAQRAGTLKQLFSKVDEQRSRHQYVEPPGNNALKTYNEILLIDPGNGKALQGLSEMGEYYLRSATREQRAGNYEESRSLISDGLRILPESSELLALKDEVNARLEVETRNNKINNLHVRANQQIAEGRLALPKGNNAYETYQKILVLEAGNKKAKSGLDRIRTRYIQLGQESKAKGDYRKGMDLVEMGLMSFPNDDALIALRAELGQELKAEQQVRLLEDLFEQANKQVLARQLTRPGGGNALDTYQKILEIDPGNSRAVNEIKNIPKLYISMAHGSQSSGLYREGLAYVREGLDHYPDNHELMSLQAELERQVQAVGERDDLNELFVKAEEQMASIRLTLPKGDNAYETYLHVLEIDPGNVKAKQGLSSIADRYATMAISRQNKGELSRSLAAIEKGLLVNPGHPGLLKLKKEVNTSLAQTPINTSLEQTTGNNRKINSLLMRAESQFTALKLIRPAGNNAHETYLEILEIDRRNRSAIVGLNQITQFYKKTALRNKREGDFVASLKNVKNALIVDPDNKDLRVLLNELENGIDGKSRTTKKSRKLERIDQLLKQANQKYDSGQLVQPEGSSAVEIYKNILVMDPGNKEALNGIDKISDALERYARARQANGDLVGGLSIVDIGLKYIPDSPGLLSVRAELKREIAAKVR